MFYSRWSFYLRSIICVLVFLLFYRFIITFQGPIAYSRSEDTARNTFSFRTIEDNDELLKYSNVYFIESSAPFQPVVTIEPRHACAIEAAARANPHKNIIVLLASWTNFTESDNLRIPDMPTLARFPNVLFRWLDLEHFAGGTPVNNVIKSERLYEPGIGAEYLSEILRLVLLYKFGGIYLDLDVVTLKTLDFYHPNFFGAESAVLANPSVMGLQPDFDGKSFAENCLRDIEYFHEKHEVRNGSILLTNRLLQVCEKITVQEIVEEGCFGRLEVYPANLFHPFDKTNVWLLFDPEKLDVVQNMISDSMAVHMLQHHSRHMTNYTNGETGYKMIAKRYCPSTYNNNKENL